MTTRATGRGARGLSLLEALATAAVLALGIVGVMSTLHAASKQNRRNNIQNQATLIAEQELERIVGLRCDGVSTTSPCANIQALDGRARKVYWSANGEPSDAPPLPGAPPSLLYTVAVDVDPPFEATETGSPSLTRTATPPASLPLNAVVNVRVTVSWAEPRSSRRAVALQTRMSR
ncbi:hypothetical protein LZ198_29845 [Myxococcus sp. K15C18031901]|uniref:hypothetical protein n=1 Tax=Myxococcus dinghuensis TaxID=2906761 RepID=UPI0020A837A8|nr:hypothetical protein [Myxococcus dinghuensis]MCP3103090.1 hypothetical protein [Myxococcus dinghuensis]